MTIPSTKIVIIGSGVAGATIARGLIDRGIGPVVMLEAGPRVPMAEYRGWVDYLTTGALPYDANRDPRADESTSAEVNQWLHGSRLFARGGSTLHWGGWSLRLRPEDFQLRAATGHGMDWPISYDDLEPYYSSAEQLLGVAGDSNYASPPRSAPYPFKPIPFTKVDGEIIRGLKSLGHDYSPMPIARNVEAHNGHPSCQTIGTCRYCPLGARFTTDQVLDRLEMEPAFTLHDNTAVTGLMMDRHDRVAGVEFTIADSGETGRIEAEHIIVCAGALESPKLLLNSISTAWPHGIGNNTEHVGRHLTSHPLLYARASRHSNPDRLQFELDFPTLCSREFDSPREQLTGKLFTFLPPVRPRINLAELMKAHQPRTEINDSVTGPVMLELQAFMELHPDPNARVAPSPTRNPFGVPGSDITIENASTRNENIRRNLERMVQILTASGYADVETGVYNPRGDHAAATCRMSLSENDGIVDRDLRVHGVENLYICSNAVFPSLGAVNPTLTLTALAIRFANRFSIN